MRLRLWCVATDYDRASWCVCTRECGSSHTSCCTNILIDSILYANDVSLCRSVLPTYSAPWQTVSTDTLHSNAPHRKGPGMALSRTSVGTTFLQPSETPTTHHAITRLKLTILILIVTMASFSERLQIANTSHILRSMLHSNLIHQYVKNPIPTPISHN